MIRDRFRLAWVGLLLAGIPAFASAQRVVVDAATLSPDTRASDTLLTRRVTLDLHHVSRQQALDAAASSARVLIQYQLQVVNAFDGDVTLRLTDASLATALDKILAGTTLRVVADRAQRLVIVDARERGVAQQSATIMGRVTDSTSGAPLVHASVSVDSVAKMVQTDVHGEFVVHDVPVGTRVVTVRILGYRLASRKVHVGDGAHVAASFAMVASAAPLTDVVTTATGQQRRVEVGNSVTTLNVDSIRAQAPVTSITDVLDGRVPGLVVQRQSGAPGAPARVRIRGLRSISASSDPIVIVDGVRMYSNQTDSEENANYSVLDNIDVTTVASIDVLKGPSASALYGSDAANGVIVIKTKHGQVGRTRWAFSTDQQRTTQPGQFQTFYYRQGYDAVLDFGTPEHCSLLVLTACEGDTLFVYNPLSNARTTVLGTGNRQQYNASVSGGAPGIQYSLSGSMSGDQGLLKMSDADQAFIGGDIPSWQRHPQQNTTTSGTARIDLQPMPSLTFGLTGGLSSDTRSTTPLDQALSVYLSGSTPADTLLVTRAIPDFRARTLYRSQTTLAAASANWMPFAAWTVNGQAGYQADNRNTQSLLRRGDCDSCAYQQPTKVQGALTAITDQPNVTSLDLYSQFRIPEWRGVQFAPSIGVNYVRTDVTSSTTQATGLVEGASSANNATQVTVMDTSSRAIQFGTFLTLGATVLDRLFASVGTRIDVSNALGSKVAPTYPKFDVSYLLSQEPLFQRVVPSALSTFRLRMAYGHSAVQPNPGLASRTYKATTTSINGVLVPSQVLGVTGNEYLKPERSTELEWGFDLGLVRDRVLFSFNAFTDHTRDALTTLQRPPSLGGGAYLTNFGAVENVGTEMDVTAIVIDRPELTWSVSGTYASNRNRLTALDPTFAQTQTNINNAAFHLGGFGNWYAVGYPLDGVWMRPVLGYADLDGNGVLSQDEIVRGDSAVFVGGPLPKYTTTFGTQIGLWHGFVTFSAAFDYRHAMSQVNQAFLSDIMFPTSSSVRALNDPSSSLREQALAITGYEALNPVSILRFQTFSLRVAAPAAWARRVGATAMSFALQGSNLGLWSNYSGADPDVTSSIVGNTNLDNGVLPQPRTWGINVSLNY